MHVILMDLLETAAAKFLVNGGREMSEKTILL
jgi:hypothetical protein